jgi:hypothetical protein
LVVYISMSVYMRVLQIMTWDKNIHMFGPRQCWDAIINCRSIRMISDHPLKSPNQSISLSLAEQLENGWTDVLTFTIVEFVGIFQFAENLNFYRRHTVSILTASLSNTYLAFNLLITS